jgi:hypothetical protein
MKKTLISIIMIGILLLHSINGISKFTQNTNSEKEITTYAKIDLDKIFDAMDPVNQETSGEPQGFCSEALVLTMGENRYVNEFSIDTSNIFKNFLINWYITGFLWKILPKYEKQVSLVKEDVTAKLSYAKGNDTTMTWIVNLTMVAELLDPKNPPDPEEFNNILLKCTVFIAVGTPHSLDLTYNLKRTDLRVISDSKFYMAKSILFKLSGIGKLYGFGATYCSASWSS